MRNVSGVLPLLLLGFTALTAPITPTRAQCPLPDGLDGGPCCARAQLNLPRFPPFGHKAHDICWKGCDIANLGGCVARWYQPRPISHSHCNIYRVGIVLDDGAGSIKWRGRAILNYARTWLETDSANGRRFQVWRFLANAQLRPTAAAGATPCPVPPCAAVFGHVRYTGYVDYALNCNNGHFSTAWMLSHVCDRIDHAPGFPRAGSFHPDHAYTFVGPSATFVPGPVQPAASGTTQAEAVRRVMLPVPGAVGACEFEERVNASLRPTAPGLCLCTTPSATPQWSIADLAVQGACGTTVATPGGPFLPGFVSMGIGAFVNPARYPGLEIVRWNAGGYDRDDPCTGVTGREVYYGVTTIRGYPATQILSGGLGANLPLTFVDQGNAKQHGSTVMNVSFFSDHIMNLNL